MNFLSNLFGGKHEEEQVPPYFTNHDYVFKNPLNSDVVIKTPNDNHPNNNPEQEQQEQQQEQKIYTRRECLPPELDEIAYTLDNVLTVDECERFIQYSEERGYEKALVNVGYGQQRMLEDLRNNDRCMHDSDEIMEQIYQRVKHLLPPTYSVPKRRGGEDLYDVVGLNERMRILRYKPGQEFKLHRDGCYVRESGPRAGEISFFTVLLYLNDTKGGQTRFYDEEDEKKTWDVNPTSGMMLVFKHKILHHGLPVTEGFKYCLRTDVMYKKREPQVESSKDNVVVESGSSSPDVVIEPVDENNNTPAAEQQPQQDKKDEKEQEQQQ